ncbi:MAG: N-acetyltransferase family protein [Chloroflexota bacterium]
MIEIRVATDLTPAEYDQLAALLVAVVDDGASIGFLPPLAPADALAYWQGVLGPNCVLLLAEEDGRIVGSAQLHLEPRANGNHRAEVAKVMVSPVARRRGLGRAFMERLEQEARQCGRTLLVLDTREGDPSNILYQAMGYQEAGRIPGYARSANGQLHATVFYFKTLT